MRLLIAVLACSFVAVALPAVGQQQFPYKAYVNAEDVYVRSGPGQSYYATDQLKPRQEVEVYRHDPGGWCAIRPIEGSFTWVSSRFLKPTGHNLAVVTEENVQARVGSRLSDSRDVIQVRLHKGEVVQILGPPHGANSQRSDSNDAAWVKIAPPSGEFRWVAAKYLDQSPPNDGIPHPMDPRHSGEAAFNPPPDAFGKPPHGGPGPRAFSPKAYQEELERLDMELSAMLTEEPAKWDFDSLRDRANYMLDQAQTAVERGRARLLANKIARFEDIRQRADAAEQMYERSERSERLLASLRFKDDGGRGGSRMGMGAGVGIGADDRFDGTGRLTLLNSQKPGAPRYALLDEAGDVRCYITPAPGVNLQNYVGKQVGVTGTRGYVPEQHASHLMARHITSLDGGPLLR
jgi:SH3-like domain-containing protein